LDRIVHIPVIYTANDTLPHFVHLHKVAVVNKKKFSQLTSVKIS